MYVKFTLNLPFQWGSSLNLLAANNSNTVLILCEHVMSAHFSQQVAAVQLTPTQLSVTQFSTGAHLALQSDMHIKGVCVTKVIEELRSGECGADISLHLTKDTELLHTGLSITKAKIDVMVTGCVLANLQDSVTVWSGKQITVYELSGTVLRNTGTTLTLSKWTKLHLSDETFYKLHRFFRPLSQFSFVKFLRFCLLNFPGSFPCDSHIVAVHGENLYTVEPNRVQIRTPQVCCPPIEPY